MTDAIAKPSKRKGPDPREDAFLRFVNRVLDWAQANLRAVLAVGVVLVLLAGAAVWYLNYQQNRQQEATRRLQSLRAAVTRGADSVGVDRFKSFLARYGGTDAARDARILLARLHLQRGDPEQAIETVRQATDRPPDTPEGYASRMLLAKAREASGDRKAALRTLEKLASGARFGFQRREAAAHRAEILVAMGRLEEAEAIYERLVEESGDGEAGQLYAVRLGEVRAMRSRGGSASGTGEATEGEGAS